MPPIGTAIPPINPYYFSYQKRFFDIVISFLGLCLAIPLLIFIAAILFATIGSPILYVQKRSGMHGKPFRIFKFRTMHVGADRKQKDFSELNQAPFPMFKVFDDPRFVGIGRFLSASGLDELPQLFNILKGEMSIIGPRPLPVAQASALDETWQFRFLVKPGLFSEWTVSEKRHSCAETWKKLEKATLAKGSWVDDFKVILRTLFRKSNH